MDEDPLGAEQQKMTGNWKELSRLQAEVHDLNVKIRDGVYRTGASQEEIATWKAQIASKEARMEEIRASLAENV